MKHYFLGAAANYKKVWRHVFARGSEKDASELTSYLSEKYRGETILTKNGRSALSLALRTYFKPGDKVMVNGFTCYAVVEALEAAGLAVAMGNATPDVRALADVVVADNDHNGIAEVVDRILLKA
jgi:DNA-binding transcriptional MocR family regulator